jgi:hypothetical protein
MTKESQYSSLYLELAYKASEPKFVHWFANAHHEWYTPTNTQNLLFDVAEFGGDKIAFTIYVGAKRQGVFVAQWKKSQLFRRNADGTLTPLMIINGEYKEIHPRVARNADRQAIVDHDDPLIRKMLQRKARILNLNQEPQQVSKAVYEPFEATESFWRLLEAIDYDYTVNKAKWHKLEESELLAMTITINPANGTLTKSDDAIRAAIKVAQPEQPKQPKKERKPRTPKTATERAQESMLDSGITAGNPHSA